MNLLVIETSTEALSVAIFSDNRLVAESSPKTEAASHCERLLPEIDSLLKQNALSVRDLGALALDVGPGSFTSLRVGLATGMGLGLETDIPVYSVSSLEALAVGHEGNQRFVAAVLPAGRGMIYGAVFERGGDAIKAVVAESSFFPESFIEQLKPYSKSLAVTGTASIPFPSSWKEVTVRRASPAARSIGLIALSGRISPSPISFLQIRYLKDPDLGHKSQGS